MIPKGFPWNLITAHISNGKICAEVKTRGNTQSNQSRVRPEISNISCFQGFQEDVEQRQTCIIRVSLRTVVMRLQSLLRLATRVTCVAVLHFTVSAAVGGAIRHHYHAAEAPLHLPWRRRRRRRRCFLLSAPRPHISPSPSLAVPLAPSALSPKPFVTVRN